MRTLASCGKNNLHKMSTTNENLGANRELEEAWFNEGKTKVSSFEEIRNTIAQRKPYHYLPLSVSAEENSTIFLAIYEERAAKRISAEEASTLQREYFETLDPSESAPDVFMDILTAKSKGWITAEEAALAIDNIVLDTRDLEIYSDLINALAKEAETFILPLYPASEKAASPVEAPAKPLTEEKRMYQNPSFLQRYVSRKALLATAAVLALGGATSLGYQQETDRKDSSYSSFEGSSEAPTSPLIVREKTQEKVAQVKAPIQQKKPVAIAPKIVVEKKASAEKETTVSLPVITKINGAGEVSMDQAKSMIAWKKLGYSIGIKNTAEGKVFVLKDSEGKKFTISQDALQKDQETIEAKLQ